MKYQLFTYAQDNGPRAGIVVADTWLDLADTAARAGRPHIVAYATVDAMLANWDTAHAAVRQLADQVAADAASFANFKLDAGSLRLPAAVLFADEYVDPAILFAVRPDHCTGSRWYFGDCAGVRRYFARERLS